MTSASNNRPSDPEQTSPDTRNLDGSDNPPLPPFEHAFSVSMARFNRCGPFSVMEAARSLGPECNLVASNSRPAHLPGSRDNPFLLSPTPQPVPMLPVRGVQHHPVYQSVGTQTAPVFLISALSTPIVARQSSGRSVSPELRPLTYANIVAAGLLSASNNLTSSQQAAAGSLLSPASQSAAGTIPSRTPKTPTSTKFGKPLTLADIAAADWQPIPDLPFSQLAGPTPGKSTASAPSPQADPPFSQLAAPAPCRSTATNPKSETSSQPAVQSFIAAPIPLVNISAPDPVVPAASTPNENASRVAVDVSSESEGEFHPEPITPLSLHRRNTNTRTPRRCVRIVVIDSSDEENQLLPSYPTIPPAVSVTPNLSTLDSTSPRSLSSASAAPSISAPSTSNVNDANIHADHSDTNTDGVDNDVDSAGNSVNMFDIDNPLEHMELADLLDNTPSRSHV